MLADGDADAQRKGRKPRHMIKEQDMLLQVKPPGVVVKCYGPCGKMKWRKIDAGAIIYTDGEANGGEYDTLIESDEPGHMMDHAKVPASKVEIYLGEGEHYPRTMRGKRRKR